VREAPADCAFLGAVAGVAVLRAHGAGAAHPPGALQGIVTLGTGFLAPAVGREVEAVAALAAGGCSAALRALVGAGLTDSTNITSPVRIVAWRAGRLTGLVVREESREFALRAVVFRLALVARRRADLANAAQVVDTLLIVAILTLLFAPVVVRQVCGVAALLAHCRTGAQTAVLRTEWAGVAHTAPHWQLPVAIWANVATHTIWVEELVVLARRANLVSVTGVAVAGTRLAQVPKGVRKAESLHSVHSLAELHVLHGAGHCIQVRPVSTVSSGMFSYQPAGQDVLQVLLVGSKK